MHSIEYRQLSLHASGVKQRELDAWQRLSRAMGRSSAEERRACLDRWLSVQQQLREAQEALVAACAWRSVVALRECAQVLLSPFADVGRDPSLRAGRRLPAAPRAGDVYLGRGDAVWDVVSVVFDKIEPHLYLAQLQQRGSEEPVDVYCEDWCLFCIVQGLRGED